MGSQQQFCLRWNDHQSNMLTVFDNLFQDEALVDVTLACEGLSLKAHKLVLSACSPFFQSLFIDNPCKHPIVILKDVRFTDLKALVDFMYKGEVNVSQDQLNRLLKTAETLKVRGVPEVTSGYCIDENASTSSGMAPPQAPTQNSRATYENNTSRSPQQTQQMSPPRKHKKTKHRSRGEKRTSHSEPENSAGGPELIKLETEIAEENFSADKNTESITSRRNQESPQRLTEDKTDITYPAGPSSTPSNARSSSGQNQTSTSSIGSAGKTISEEQLSNQSSTHQNTSQAYASPGQDVGQLSRDSSTSSLYYKRPKGPILYEEEEDEIVDFIKVMAAKGKPLGRNEILEYGNMLLRKAGRRPMGRMYMYCSKRVRGLSPKWWRDFKKRHPGLPHPRQRTSSSDDSLNRSPIL